MGSEIVKWWNNKWAVLIMVIGVLTVGVGFLFAYFIPWGWILSIATAIIGGVGIRTVLIKLLCQLVGESDTGHIRDNTDSTEPYDSN